MYTSRRAAIVTGGSAGIGYAVAEMLASEGYDVTVAARDLDRLLGTASQLRRQGSDIEPVACNVAFAEDCDRLVAAHVERFGRLDVLVNNAGVGLHSDIADLPQSKLDLHLNLNLRSAYRLMQLSIPHLKRTGTEHGKALVVNMSSLYGKLPQAGVAAYSMTKAALIALSQAAHGELSESGIQVTAVCPGLVDTPGASWAQDARAKMLPGDVAEAVRFLLRTSPQCVVPEIVMTTPGPDINFNGFSE